MAGKISELPQLTTTPAPDDEFEVLDVSDQGNQAEGENKRVTAANVVGCLGAAGSELSISSNEITITGHFHRVGTGGIHTINGGQEGWVLVLTGGSSGGTEIYHGSGNILLANGSTAFLNNANGVLHLVFDGTHWQELTRGRNEGV